MIYIQITIMLHFSGIISKEIMQHANEYLEQPCCQIGCQVEAEK